MGKLKQKKIIRKCRRITHANESPVESAVVWFLKGRRDIEEVESGITKKKIQRKKREQHEREMDEKRLRKKRKKRRWENQREKQEKRGTGKGDVNFQPNENSVDDATETFSISSSSLIRLGQHANVYTCACVCDIMFFLHHHFAGQLYTSSTRFVSKCARSYTSCIVCARIFV